MIKIILKTPSKTAVLLLFIVGLLVLNTLSLINAGIHEFLYKGISSLSLPGSLPDSPTNRQKRLEKEKKQLDQLYRDKQQLSSQLNVNEQKMAAQKRKVKQLTGRMARRVVRNTALNTASIPAESVPWVGAGLVIAVTAIDVKDSCDTMNDMNSIMQTLEMNGDHGGTTAVVVDSIPVCQPDPIHSLFGIT